MVQRKKFDVILSFLVDGYRRTKPPKSDASQFVVPARLPKPVIGSDGLSSSRFDDDVPEVNCTWTASFSWRVKEAALWFVRLQRSDRRDNMIFTVHLNRLIDENIPLEQSTIETCQQEAYKYQKVTKISCDIGSRFEASWLDCVTMMSEMTAAVIVVSSSLSSLDAGWFRLITNILIQSRDLAMIARWHQCGTMTSHMLARASLSAVCLTVFPFEFSPRTFTIGFYGKNSIISELMILKCSFPLIGLKLVRTDIFSYFRGPQKFFKSTKVRN